MKAAVIGGIFAIAAVVVGVLLPYLIPEEPECDCPEIHPLEIQTDNIVSMIYRDVDIMISSVLVHSKMVQDKYGSTNISVSEFVDSLRKNNVDKVVLFGKNYYSSPIAAYNYLMEPVSSECDFVNYAYLEHMDRPDGGLGLESCTESEQYTIYLSSVYPSTGTTDYVSSISVPLDLNSDGDIDLIFATAMNLNEFSKDIQDMIGIEGSKVVLVNSDGQVVADCTIQGCLDYDVYAQEQIDVGIFSKDSKPILYDEIKYTDAGYEKYASIPLSNDELRFKMQNSKFLSGWILHVFTNIT